MCGSYNSVDVRERENNFGFCQFRTKIYVSFIVNLNSTVKTELRHLDSRPFFGISRVDKLYKKNVIYQFQGVKFNGEYHFLCMYKIRR